MLGARCQVPGARCTSGSIAGIAWGMEHGTRGRSQKPGIMEHGARSMGQGAESTGQKVRNYDMSELFCTFVN
ncbi:MAG: hypothetical protein IH591_03100 [Bacteroidales bacterium]|nr:hypothetical protein [Bacteroidales bacterium]